MIAVVPVRLGALPAGGAEAVAECGGRAIVVGESATVAAAHLVGLPTLAESAGPPVRAWDVPGFAPAAWAAALVPLLEDEPVVVLPATPDGRDLAPRLARALNRPLLAGAVAVDEHGARLARWGGLVLEDAVAHGPFVATLIPGSRGVEHHAQSGGVDVEVVELELPWRPDAEVLEVLAPDAATMDLAEAPRILGGGAGLDSAERFATLHAVAAALDASMGATRVVTDRGWVSHSRQIGTTGVVVDPRLYLAFGISGAVQHTSGLGDPEHIVSVNTDPSCPMMQMADLAVEADANATLDALARRLGLTATTTDGKAEARGA